MVDHPFPRVLAAIDLGSNSFHMLVARVVRHTPVIVDRLREPVQLARGLDSARRITRRARQRALACLELFSQRVRGIEPEGVRAVATSTLRVARDARGFLSEAETVLGHPIEVVSGREEARLIYLGASHTLPEESGLRLVVDVGGGSTECILGQRFEPLRVDSLEMGCVSFSRRFFPGGAIRRPRWRDAVLAARLEVRAVASRFRERGWSSAAGASGTVRAVEQVLREKGWSGGGITADGLGRLEQELLDAGHIDRADLAAVKDDRRPVFAGGVAILAAVFEGLRLERMDACAGALREGVLYDLLGRLQHEDVRERTISAFQDRYHVDHEQAARVEATALALLDGVAGVWGIDAEEGARALSWSSRLHEIGLALSFEGHHRHAAYLVANSDMPGFSSDDQELLAVLLATHRRKVRRADFRQLPERTRELAVRLAVLQRLAVRLHRGRSPEPLPAILLRASPDGLAVALPPGWLERNPLTRADLETETDRVKPLGVRLEVHEATGAAEPVPA